MALFGPSREAPEAGDSISLVANGEPDLPLQVLAVEESSGAP